MMTPSPSGRRRKILWTLIALGGPLGSNACRPGSAQDSAELVRAPRNVRVVTIEERALSRPITSTGTFGPKDEIALSFKVGGVVRLVDVDAGTAVRAGQTLASLDLREIEAALHKARTLHEKAERDLERARRLYEDSVATLSQLQDAETAAELAAADLESAVFNRRYAEIVAPTDGVVLRRAAEPGETVTPGVTIVVLGSRARGGVLRVGLTDRDVVRIRKGDSAEAGFDAIPDRTFPGVVTEIAASATPGTGTYAVEISLRGAEDLPAGIIGRVELRPAAGTPTTVVPVEAVLEADRYRAVVYALSPDGARAERREITVAFLDGDRVAVVSGLEGATSVVTDGSAWLSDGEPVRVLR